MASSNVALIVCGAVLIAAGAIFYFCRAFVTRAIVSGQKLTFGKLADPVVKGARARQVGILGILWGSFGLLLILLGIFLPPYHGHISN